MASSSAVNLRKRGWSCASSSTSPVTVPGSKVTASGRRADDDMSISSDESSSGHDSGEDDLDALKLSGAVARGGSSSSSNNSNSNSNNGYSDSNGNGTSKYKTASAGKNGSGPGLYNKLSSLTKNLLKPGYIKSRMDLVEDYDEGVGNDQFIIQFGKDRVVGEAGEEGISVDLDYDSDGEMDTNNNNSSAEGRRTVSSLRTPSSKAEAASSSDDVGGGSGSGSKSAGKSSDQKAKDAVVRYKVTNLNFSTSLDSLTSAISKHCSPQNITLLPPSSSEPGGANKKNSGRAYITFASKKEAENVTDKLKYLDGRQIRFEQTEFLKVGPPFCFDASAARPIIIFPRRVSM